MNISTISSRVARLEARVVQLPARPMTKQQRDELVRRFLEQGSADVLAEPEPHRRAAIEAAFRADH